MAREKTPEENAADNERKQLVEEKKNLKKEQQPSEKKQSAGQGKLPNRKMNWRTGMRGTAF